jgi:glycosyltransferase involved in cell wall biosynthesis
MIDIIVPCRNEENYIKKFLISLFEQTYINKVNSIIIADGMSDDKSVTHIKEFMDWHDEFKKIRLIKNTLKVTPSALNLAIAASTSDYICRLDVHAIYPPNYLEELYKVITSDTFDCVGAKWNIQPSNNTSTAIAIARASSSKLAVGNVPYRATSNSLTSFVTVVNAVPYGFFRRDVFDRIGMFDVDLVRNQDNELYDRMLESGMKIGLLGNVQIKYFARENFPSLWKNYYGYGQYTPPTDWRRRKISVRRVVPPIALIIFTSVLAISVKLAISLLVFYATLIAIYGFNNRIPGPIISKYIIAHAVIHSSFAIGYFRGLIHVIFFRNR